MSRPVVLGFTLLIGALAVLVLWLQPAGRAGVERAEHESVPREVAEPSVPPSLLRAEGRDGAQSDSTAVAADTEADTTRAAQRSPASDRRPRISGTVRVPGGIPVGEEVRLRAEVSSTSGGGATRKLAAPVASDGSFTLVVPENTSHASLDLEARFLVLGKAVTARPGETDVVLAPLVYANVEGEVVPPQSLSTLEASWSDMEVSWSLGPRRDLGSEAMLSATRSPSRDKCIEPDHDGGFVLTFLPVGVELDLHVENPFGPEWIQRIEPLAPAERRRITIALELGITISGRVIDEHGQPVAGADISTDEDHGPHAWCSRRKNAPSDAGGRFVLDRMPRRVTKISVMSSDLAFGAETAVDGTSGDVRGVVLSVVRGGCIEGTVFWSDGSPVDGFEIRASGPIYAKQDLVGNHFRLCGLGDGNYRVEVRALRGEVAGTAQCVDVRPGAAPIELRLAEARVYDVRGALVDELDAPIENFSVRARQLTPEGWFRTADESRDGGFVLVGLEAGEWTLEAEARGYLSTRQKVVLGEGTLPLLRIVLRSAGRIRGKVVDSAGAPVADAWVGEEEDVALIGLPAPRSDSTDAEGTFELQPTSTRARILASKRGFSPSDVQEYEVGPGETLDGIVLHLRETCRVVGRVLDEHGDPLPGVKVSSSAISSMGTSVEVNALGVFELDGLPPGAALVLAYHPQRDGMASATVTLTPGQSASVDLRFEKPDPVLIHGRVTRGGKPVECNFGLLCRGFATECASGSDGRFEVSLQRPGEWKGAVWLASESFSLPDLTRIDVRRFEISIPDEDQHAFELEFDALPRLTSMEELFR